MTLESSNGSLDFFSLSRDDLASVLADKYDLKNYRATQLFDWVYRKGLTDFSGMTNLKKEVRDNLTSDFEFNFLSHATRKISQDGTRKYLFDLGNGQQVETVMIKQPTRMTLCVSSQVGCAMGCTFCRTGTMGLHRNLSVSEIVGQVYAVREDAKNFDDDFTNIVFMGMGEPLHNIKNVLPALRILRDDFAFGVGARKITVSTVGLVPAIQKFAESDADVNLAVSLNATTNEVRSKIMPINKRFPLEVLLQTLREFPLKRRRKITIEYVMLAGVNDTQADIKRLIKLMHGLKVKINLIPYNENAGLGFKAPKRSWISHWHNSLVQSGVDVTVRWSKGADIDAACGQLVSNHQNNGSN